MLLIDPAGPGASELMAQGFGLADALVPVAADIIDQLIDALEQSAVVRLPGQVVAPAALGELDLHADCSVRSSGSISSRV